MRPLRPQINAGYTISLQQKLARSFAICDAHVRHLDTTFLTELQKRQCSWLQMQSALCEDRAPAASTDRLKARAAPTPHASAPLERLGSSPWPQEPASGRSEDGGGAHLPRVGSGTPHRRWSPPTAATTRGGASSARAARCSRGARAS